MSMQDLFQALQMFQNGVKEAAVTTAVNDATKQMDAIKMSQIDEAAQRRALQDLSNQTALRLTGAGANGTQIQSAFNAIAPQNFGSAEQMQLEGALSGNQQLQQVSSEIIGGRESKAERAEQRAFNRQLALQDRQFQQQALLAGLKGEGKRASVPGFEIAPGVNLTDKDLEALKTGSESYMNIDQALTSLDKMVGKSGTEALTVPIFGGQDKKQMQQLKTSMVLQLKEMEKLGALAGPDVEVLENIMPDPTAYRTAQYTKASQVFRTELKNRLKNRGLARGARFVGFEGEQQQAVDALPLEVRTLNDGTKVKGRTLPNGDFEAVD